MAIFIAAGVAVAGRPSLRATDMYRNPVLAGDYSDPDAVRVGEDYYLVASSFTNVPGLPILHSRDLVNWQLIGHALPRLTPDAHYGVPRRGGGAWAPAIVHHEGIFRIYYPDPDFGIFVVSARNPAGPWSTPVLVDATVGAIDPSPFWDDDGSAWLAFAYAKSRAGISNRIMLKRMDATGSHTTGEAMTIIDGDTLPPVRTSIGLRPWQTTEGPKLYKRDGWYWVFVPSGSVKGGWQGVFRSRTLQGPWEGRDVLDQGRTTVNGPHQGAWIRTSSSEDWFLHFSDADSYGRRVHLQPMRWSKGWPVIGRDTDGDGIGEPVDRYRRPKVSTPVTMLQPFQGDEFDGPLSLEWQWQSNPASDWLRTGRSGWLRLSSASTSADLWEAGNLLSLKLPSERFVVTTKLRFMPLRVGERAGLAIFGADYGWLGIEKTAEGTRIVRATRQVNNGVRGNDQIVLGAKVSDGVDVWLRMSAEPITLRNAPPDFQPYWPSMLRSRHALVQFSYSMDGRSFVQVGDAFTSQAGRWVGAQIGIFAQAPSGKPAYTATTTGYADYDWLRMSY
jgi:beta-xylosidase